MANNIQIIDANAVVQTVSTTLSGGVHTPHNIIDSGLVQVSNFPSVQTVSGSVAISNFPVTQPVSFAIGQAVQLLDSGGTNKVSISAGGALKVDASGAGGGSVSQGTAAATAAAWPIKVTDGTTVAGVIVGTTALKTDLSSVAGTATVTAAAGVQKVGIVGGSGATVDSTVAAGAAPTNAVAVGSVYNSTAPAPTTGQAMAQQADWQGSLFVRPSRRSATVAQATTIASSGAATTVLAAQAAGIFADLSALVITVVPGATAHTSFTATLTDGTNNFVFDLDTGALATAPAVPVPLVVNFPAPLPATTAATAWTITLSSATVTVHITVVAVLQKAS